MPIGVIIGLSGASGGSAGNPQDFQYTATGAEGAQFTVTLPSSRANTNYSVHGSYESSADINYPPPTIDNKTKTTFRCRVGTQMTAGDKITFIVEDLR